MGDSLITINFYKNENNHYQLNIEGLSGVERIRAKELIIHHGRFYFGLSRFDRLNPGLYTFTLPDGLDSQNMELKVNFNSKHKAIRNIAGQVFHYFKLPYFENNLLER